MKTVATAGHVDHGKSSLVSVLTGIDPDRLKEEKARKMTIDLGFAWMEMPSGETVGIIDVPGHRDFIENMLAGVGGIDAVIFVIAADEGIMPQTREHLAILDLLSVNKGLIALTKVDLSESSDWLELVKADIRAEVKNTFLEDAPMISVSARTKEGIKEVIDSLQAILDKVTGQVDSGKPRCSVDRVFSLTGFGTIVTATLIDGVLVSGDEVKILPSGLSGRIRGLQTHKTKAQTVHPGSRVAINISGIEVGDIKRGDLVTTSDSYKPTNRFDAFINVMPISSRPIKHNQEIKIFHLAAERLARIRVLGKDQILPGEDGYIQIECVDPIVVAAKDRFVMRIPSPGETIGGGVVLQTHSPRRYKRNSSEVMKRLIAINTGTLDEKILESANRTTFCSIRKVAAELNVNEEEIRETIDKYVDTGELIYFAEPGLNELPLDIVSKRNWEALVNQANQILNDYHRRLPLRAGIPREEFKNKLKVDQKKTSVFFQMLKNLNTISETNGFIHLENFEIKYLDDQKSAISRLDSEIDRSPFTPPSLKIFRELLGEELFIAQTAKKEIIRLTEDIAFREKEYSEMKNFVKEHITAAGSITVVEFRDHFSTSRKYALAFLEHLDAIGNTVREGDFRKMGNFNK